MSELNRSNRAAGIVPRVFIDSEGAVPIHEQVYRQLREQIERGVVASGARLASSRVMAREFGVSRFTMTTALSQLAGEGWITTSPASGTFVTTDIPQANTGRTRRTVTANDSPGQSSPVLSGRGSAISRLVITGPRNHDGGPRPFQPRRPPLDAFPMSLWTRIVREQWRQPPLEILDYGDPAGDAQLRVAVARHVNATRGVQANPEQVIITTGGQQALSIVAKLLIDPGDAVWFEEPGSRDARGALVEAGAHLVPVAVDDAGMQVDEGIRQAPAARLAYVSPSHQYPTGAALSNARRRTLVEWAATTGAWIIEDDYDSYFRFAGRPLPALQQLDAELAGGKATRVVYIGTFSKTMYPSLRLGYAIVPAGIAAAVANARANADRNSPAVEQRAMAQFIERGYFDRHLRRLRTTCAQRHDMMQDSLHRHMADVATASRMRSGTHVVLTLNSDTAAAIASKSSAAPAVAIAEAAASAGLVVFPMERYAMLPTTRAQLVLGYASWDAVVIDEAVQTLTTVVRSLAS